LRKELSEVFSVGVYLVKVAQEDALADIAPGADAPTHFHNQLLELLTFGKSRSTAAQAKRARMRLTGAAPAPPASSIPGVRGRLGYFPR
jgi:hypothetical protein